MTTNQQRLEYAVSPNFKADIFTGKADVERGARSAFIGEVLYHPIPLADTDQATCLANVARWVPAGLDTIFRGIVENGARIDALTVAFTGAIAAMQGGAPFDQEKFLASVEKRVAAGVAEGFSATGDLVFKLETGATDKTEETKEAN